MSDQSVDPDAPNGEAEALDEHFSLSRDFIRRVLSALEEGRNEEVKALLSDLHAADFADLLGQVGSGDCRLLLELMGTDLDSAVLSDLDKDVRDEVLQYLDPQIVARAVTELDSDDATYLLEDLSEEEQREVLTQVPDHDRIAVEMGLRYPELSAGRLMQREFITIPPFWSVGETIDYMRETDDLPNEFVEIFIVDPGLHPIGIVALNRILRSGRSTKIEDLMDEKLQVIPAHMAQEEVAYAFDQYHLMSAPVVDESGRIVGMITIDDMVDVIQDEAEEDILKLGGVSDEEGLSDNVFRTTSRRFSWLAVNLVTAIGASLVISFFGEAISQYVALAILMPIVASMGGNAGTQTLTVAVRAIATKDLTATNAARIIVREALVGGLNGILFAIVLGLLCGLWFQDLMLALVIGIAMIVNLLAAGLAGILVPLGLQRAGADPALASTVFVTTVTDVVGFFVFLGLATIILLG